MSAPPTDTQPSSTVPSSFLYCTSPVQARTAQYISFPPPPPAASFVCHFLTQVFKPFRLLRAVETITPGNDAVVEQTAKTMAYFVSTLFLASGLVQVRCCCRSYT